MGLGSGKIVILLCLIVIVCISAVAFCCGEGASIIITVPIILFLGDILVNFPNVERPITVSGNKVPELPVFKLVTNKQAIEEYINNLTIQEALDIVDKKVEGRGK